MTCSNCNRPLNESIFNDDRTKKSCPSCSTKNGVEHVFYDYPEAFGITDRRISINNPDGPQSYCTPCRGDKDSEYRSELCSNVI
jgi:hypothetical protein